MLPRSIGGNELRDFGLFGKLSPQQRNAVAAITIEKKYAASEVFYKKNSLNRKVVLITRGSLDCLFDDAAAAFVAQSFELGDEWGYESVVMPSHRYAYSIRAGEGGCTTFEIDTAKLFKLFATEETLKNRFMTTVYEATVQNASAIQKQLAAAGTLYHMLLTPQRREITIDQALEHIAGALDARKSLLARFDETSQVIFIEGAVGFRPTIAGMAFSLPGDTLLSLVYNTRKLLSISPVTFERKFSSAPYSTKHFLALPILSGEQCLGALAVGSNDRQHNFSSSDELFLTVASAMIGNFFTAMHNELAQTYHDYVKRTYIISHSRF